MQTVKNPKTTMKKYSRVPLCGIPAAPRADKRLRALASFIPHGSVAADIGTDHAYLPVYLAANGISSHVYAMDINMSPLSVAAANIKRFGLEDKITPILSNGLDALEREGAANQSPDVIVIAGMGGELICHIIEKSRLSKSGVKLVLQPATRAGALREYLYTSGFFVSSEQVVKSSGRLYYIICAEYRGESVAFSPSPLEKYIGRYLIENKNRDFDEYIQTQRLRLERILEALEKSPDNDIVTDYGTKEELSSLYTKLFKI